MSIVVVQYAHGGTDVLHVETRDLGAPGSGQVAIEQKAIGFNYLDILQRKGVLSLSGPERIMGIEGAGIVTAVGPDVSEFKVGDRVGYLRSQGAYSSARLIETSDLIPLPDGVSFDQAAAFIVKGFMAWLSAVRICKVQAGQTVIVTTAAGGIGSLMVRLAKHLGARVIAVIGTASKRDAALANGATEVAVGLDEAIEIADRLTGGAGVDLVLDGMGAGVAEKLVAERTVGSGATIISFGNVEGWPTADPELLAQGGITFVPLKNGLFYIKSTEELREAVAEVFALLEQGAFGNPPITTYTLADAARLHDDVEARRVTGLVILHP